MPRRISRRSSAVSDARIAARAQEPVARVDELAHAPARGASPRTCRGVVSSIPQARQHRIVAWRAHGGTRAERFNRRGASSGGRPSSCVVEPRLCRGQLREQVDPAAISPSSTSASRSRRCTPTSRGCARAASAASSGPPTCRPDCRARDRRQDARADRRDPRAGRRYPERSRWPTADDVVRIRKARQDRVADRRRGRPLDRQLARRAAMYTGSAPAT